MIIIISHFKKTCNYNNIVQDIQVAPTVRSRVCQCTKMSLQG